VSEGSFQNRILFCIKYKVLFDFAIAASVAVEVLDAALPVFMTVN
jgi:hypothetical protein